MSCSETLFETNEIIKMLFGKNITGVILPIEDNTTSLLQSELAIIQNVSVKRLREFSTGRLCARRALTNLGITNFPILRNKDRAPLWPEGVVGSITHCHDICGAVVAKNVYIRSIGFDIENIKSLKHDITKYICTTSELDWLNSKRKSEHKKNTLEILLFSLKESIFKCIFPSHKIHLSFKDCSIMPHLDANTASVNFHHKIKLTNIDLRFLITEQYIYSSAINYY